MRFYSISEEQWDKTLKETKLQEDAKAFRKKMIMGKGKEVKK